MKESYLYRVANLCNGNSRVENPPHLAKLVKSSYTAKQRGDASDPNNSSTTLTGAFLETRYAPRGATFSGTYCSLI